MVSVFSYGMNSNYRNAYKDAAAFFTGRRTYENTVASVDAQIGYEEYLRRGNERALADWHRNLPGRTIRYPEFSYAGQIRRSDTAIARLGYESDSAYANYYGNLPYRTAGLYGISGRVARSL